jgi:hypothetical protein
VWTTGSACGAQAGKGVTQGVRGAYVGVTC